MVGLHNNFVFTSVIIFSDRNFRSKDPVSIPSWHRYSNTFNCVDSLDFQKTSVERIPSVFCYRWSWLDILFWLRRRFKESVAVSIFLPPTQNWIVSHFIYLYRYLPTNYQCALTSATLSEDVQSLKQLVLHQPVTLKLEEPELPPASQLTQYQIYAEEGDKAVLIYALFKLNLVRGKTIVFVRSVDRCYK